MVQIDCEIKSILPKQIAFECCSDSSPSLYHRSCVGIVSSEKLPRITCSTADSCHEMHTHVSAHYREPKVHEFIRHNTAATASPTIAFLDNVLAKGKALTRNDTGRS